MDPAPPTADPTSHDVPATDRWARARSAWPRYRSLAVVVAVALAARILYWLLVTPAYTPFSDAFQYRNLASNVAAGRGFVSVFPQMVEHPTAFRPPLYPHLLAGWFRLTGDSVGSARVLSVVLGVAAVAVTWLLVVRISTRRAALVAGLAMALSPTLIANDTSILTESLSLLLLATMLLTLSSHRWALAGVVCGLLVLTRPSAQFVVVLVVLWLLWQVGWRRSLGFAAITALVVSPWVVRNWVELGEPLLVTSNGFNAAAMYSPQARESQDFVDAVFDSRFDDMRLYQFDEAAWQKELQRRAMASLREHPTQVVSVVHRNLLRYFELDPQANRGAEILDGRDIDFRTATLPVFYLVTVVGLFGLVVSRRNPPALLIAGLAAYFAASSLLLISVPRLRAPFEWCCCVGVGLAVAWWSGRRRRPPSEGRDQRDATAAGAGGA